MNQELFLDQYLQPKAIEDNESFIKNVNTESRDEQSSLNIDKAHFLIYVDDETFLNRIEVHAIINGGSSSVDLHGNKHIYYSIFRNGDDGDREIAVLCGKASYSNKDDIAWNDGLSRKNNYAQLYYIHELTTQMPVYQSQKYIKVQGFVIEKSLESQGTQEQKEIIKQAEKIKQAWGIPIQYIDNNNNLSTVDEMLAGICNSLQTQNDIPNIKSFWRKFFEIKIRQTVIFTGQVYNVLFGTLLAYFAIMETKDSLDISIQIIINIWLLLILSISSYAIFQWLIYNLAERNYSIFFDFVSAIYIVSPISQMILSTLELMSMQDNDQNSILFIMLYFINIIISIIAGFVFYNFIYREYAPKLTLEQQSNDEKFKHKGQNQQVKSRFDQL